MLKNNSLAARIFSRIAFLLHAFVPASFRHSAAILMYHSVDSNSEFFTVTPTTFAEQMAYLHKNSFTVIRLDDLAQKIARKEKIAPKTVVLTFDDGYEDNFTHAFPILKQYNFPATIFLMTGFIGQKQYTNSRGVMLPMLDWSQIIEMDTSGLVDFQPHTVSHPRLPDISIESAREEMLQSKIIIEEKLTKKCRLFAYPKGLYNDKVLAVTKDIFDAACTVRRGFATSRSVCIELPRNSIDSAVGSSGFSLRI